MEMVDLEMLTVDSASKMLRETCKIPQIACFAFRKLLRKVMITVHSSVS